MYIISRFQCIRHNKNMGFDIKDFPHSYNMYRNEITLPLHTCLTDEQVEYVIEQFNRNEIIGLLVIQQQKGD